MHKYNVSALERSNVLKSFQLIGSEYYEIFLDKVQEIESGFGCKVTKIHLMTRKNHHA